MIHFFDSIFCGVKTGIFEQIPMAAQRGFGGVGMTREMAENLELSREAAKMAADYGIVIDNLTIPADFLSEAVTDEIFQEKVKVLARYAKSGEAAGVTYGYNRIWPGSHLRGCEENFEWVVKRVTTLRDVLKDYGIMYGVEFVGPQKVKKSFPYPFFDSFAGALAVADEVRNVGLIFDVFHWYCSGGRMEDLYLAARQVDRILAFHLNDGTRGLSREEQEDGKRSLPLTADLADASVPYRILKRAGYNGPVVCEPFQPFMKEAAEQPVEEVMARILAAETKVRKKAEIQTK